MMTASPPLNCRRAARPMPRSTACSMTRLSRTCLSTRQAARTSAMRRRTPSAPSAATPSTPAKYLENIRLTGVEKLEERAFSTAKALKHIDLANSVQLIDTYACANLSTLTYLTGTGAACHRRKRLLQHGSGIRDSARHRAARPVCLQLLQGHEALRHRQHGAVDLCQCVQLLQGHA